MFEQLNVEKSDFEADNQDNSIYETQWYKDFNSKAIDIFHNNWAFGEIEDWVFYWIDYFRSPNVNLFFSNLSLFISAIFRLSPEEKCPNMIYSYYKNLLDSYSILFPDLDSIDNFYIKENEDDSVALFLIKLLGKRFFSYKSGFMTLEDWTTIDFSSVWDFIRKYCETWERILVDNEDYNYIEEASFLKKPIIDSPSVPLWLINFVNNADISFFLSSHNNHLSEQQKNPEPNLETSEFDYKAFFDKYKELWDYKVINKVESKYNGRIINHYYWNSIEPEGKNHIYFNLFYEEYNTIIRLSIYSDKTLSYFQSQIKV